MQTAQEVKNRTSERFGKWAEKYDRSYLQSLVFRDSHDMFIEAMKPYFGRDDLKVLDVGCGTGEFIAKVRSFSDNIDLHGVDISPEMVDVASSKFNGSNASFKFGDVENLPYEDSLFDIVTCSHSFHHYPDQGKAVSEMHRVLKTDGKLMIVDGCRDKVLGKLIFGQYIRRKEKDVYHILAKELQELFSVNGFTEVTQHVFNPLIPLLFTVGTKK